MKKDVDNDGEDEPKDKQPHVKKTRSQLIAEFTGKKVSISGTSSQKKNKTKGPSI